MGTLRMGGVAIRGGRRVRPGLKQFGLRVLVMQHLEATVVSINIQPGVAGMVRVETMPRVSHPNQDITAAIRPLVWRSSPPTQLSQVELAAPLAGELKINHRYRLSVNLETGRLEGFEPLVA